MNCQKLVDSYIQWLCDKTKIAEIDGACEITTPFMDRHNDHLQVFVVPMTGGMRITDDGYILSDLESCGCQIKTLKHREKIFKTILNGFGVKEKDGELYVNATQEDFPQKKHFLIQAMLTVNDMFMVAKKRVATFFLEDVSSFLDQHEIRYSPDVSFAGKGFTHKFDFVIPKSKEKPERLLRAINNPTNDSAKSLLFALTDTKQVRTPESQFYAMLNDQEKEISKNILSAFEEYDVTPLLWSDREQYTEELVA